MQGHGFDHRFGFVVVARAIEGVVRHVEVVMLRALFQEECGGGVHRIGRNRFERGCFITAYFVPIACRHARVRKIVKLRVFAVGLRGRNRRTREVNATVSVSAYRVFITVRFRGGRFRIPVELGGLGGILTDTVQNERTEVHVRIGGVIFEIVYRFLFVLLRFVVLLFEEVFVEVVFFDLRFALVYGVARLFRVYGGGCRRAYAV